MDTKVYFLKEILSNSIIIGGTAINWENIGGNRGVLALDPANAGDAKYIPDLEKYAQRGVGGVVKLTETEYTEKKSQAILTPSVRPKEMLRARQGPSAPRVRTPAAEAMAAVAAPVDVSAPAVPAEVQSPASGNQAAAEAAPTAEAFRPTTRRISRRKASAMP